MRYHLQKHSHDPDNGSYGDCQRTCFACLLDLDNVEEVPNFTAQEAEPGEVRTMLELMEQWLEDNGLKLVRFAGHEAEGEHQLEALLKWMSVWNPGQSYMVIGTSPRGHSHVVIARDDRFIHDPSPEGGDLAVPYLVAPEPDSGYYWVEFLVNVRPELRPPQREVKA